MYSVNITATQEKLLAQSDMFIQHETVYHTYPNGLEVEKQAIEIMEDGTDFYICYTLNDNGSYSLYKTDIEDTPRMIQNTRELTNLVKQVI